MVERPTKEKFKYTSYSCSARVTSDVMQTCECGLYAFTHGYELGRAYLRQEHRRFYRQQGKGPYDLSIHRMSQQKGFRQVQCHGFMSHGNRVLSIFLVSSPKKSPGKSHRRNRFPSAKERDNDQVHPLLTSQGIPSPRARAVASIFPS